ncbi:MAG: tRNA (adenosine(37)-N6)-threonylcarbamoyltransferase complex transferase subunit TsaD [Candidatus Spechtbacterales bacterium]
MRILAIETSCDDTCIAIIEAKPQGGSKIPHFRILSNVVSSQTKIHKKYGGVVPSLAKRAHQENLPLVLKRALKNAGLPETEKPSAGWRIDLIAVTHGPGLEPALWAGVNFAKELSRAWKIPLLGVDHMEGHIAANFLHGKGADFPAVVLAVSGGHTQLILVKDILKYKLLGETMDDAAGEGFDKVARMLGLGFPGGPEIAKMAKGGDPSAFAFPRPMMHSKDYNFSFSGLKTAVLYKIKKLLNLDLNTQIAESKLNKINLKTKRDIAASFQRAVVDVLISKTIKAAKEYNAKTIMLAGGVAANAELRKQLGQKIKQLEKIGELKAVSYKLPAHKLATDNAAMIAAAAYFRRNKATLTRWKILKADGNLKIK